MGRDRFRKQSLGALYRKIAQVSFPILKVRCDSYMWPSHES